mmetsp:Transcript_2006/g.6023  ORF Transcript_2006/g.6023 Transcript_2006/m.6023 type:complete len:390 (+) Transcript_2006:16-1185(+)
MKVRAVSVGFCGSPEWEELRSRLHVAKKIGTTVKSSIETCFGEEDIVQELRLVTSPFGEWASSIDLEALDKELDEAGVENISLGKAVSDEDVAMLPKVIAASTKISCSAALRHDGHGPDPEHAEKLAEFICTLTSEQGFRFCVASQCPDGIPFFPVATRASGDEEKFFISVALENSDVLVQASRRARDLVHFRTELIDAMNPILRKIEKAVKIATTAERAEQKGFAGAVVEYMGTDPSWNPSLEKDESIVLGFETVLGHPFGSRGTLAVAAASTAALRSLEGKTVGYVGLMLPVMEDFYLAERVQEKRVGLSDILQLSSVCGVGLDTVPIPAAASSKDVTRVIMDVGSLSVRWNKPLSLRLLRVDGSAGDPVDLNDDRLVPAAVMSIDS